MYVRISYQSDSVEIFTDAEAKKLAFTSAFGYGRSISRSPSVIVSVLNSGARTGNFRYYNLADLDQLLEVREILNLYGVDESCLSTS
jgi:hypothetical protein